MQIAMDFKRGPENAPWRRRYRQWALRVGRTSRAEAVGKVCDDKGAASPDRPQSALYLSPVWPPPPPPPRHSPPQLSHFLYPYIRRAVVKHLPAPGTPWLHSNFKSACAHLRDGAERRVGAGLSGQPVHGVLLKSFCSGTQSQPGPRHSPLCSCPC